MEKYLYGAAVQGIQQFIFRTNELKDIVGASELVEQICTTAFDEFANNGESVVRAAGNIKFIFNNKSDCEKAVREFPKKVMTKAPGITISQAVVPLGEDFGKAIDTVEDLLKEQRNKPARSVTFGLMGVKRANNTGMPVTRIVLESYKENGETKNKEVYQDEASEQISSCVKTKKLCEKSFGEEWLSHKEVAYDISDVTDKNDWIAVIHADGNGLGKVVQKVGKDKDDFREFSQKLDKATKEAANMAYEAVKDKFKLKVVIPIRPVVLSGDDMTVIIRGDLALDYATEFIREFEIKTQENLNPILRKWHVFAEDKDYLTACAGIAYIKSSYPFYYGYQLAEELCGEAKKDTKAIHGKESDHLPPSCLMFHKVQDSFIFDYEDIVERELKATDDLSFKAGPYYIHSQAQKFEVSLAKQLTEQLDTENGEGLRSGIRDWISLRLENKNKAEQRRTRMLQIFTDEKIQNTVKELTAESDNRCLAYDVLALYTIMNQQTKDDNLV